MNSLSDRPNILNAAITEKQMQEQHDPIYQKIAERTRDVDCKQFVDIVPYLQPFPNMKESYKHVPSIVPRRR